jgi:hypothetical protein
MRAEPVAWASGFEEISSCAYSSGDGTRTSPGTGTTQWPSESGVGGVTSLFITRGRPRCLF